MMRRNNYVDEVINIKILVAVSLMELGWLLFILMMFYEEAFGAIIACSIVFLLILLIMVIAYVQKKVFTKKRNQIIDSSFKISGKVHGIKEKSTIDRDSDGRLRYRYTYFAIVEYFYNDKKEVTETPEIIFKNDNIVDKEVDVYISQKGIYIDIYKEEKLKGFFRIK